MSLWNAFIWTLILQLSNCFSFVDLSELAAAAVVGELHRCVESVSILKLFEGYSFLGHDAM
jgi:hypothetical protein